MFKKKENQTAVVERKPKKKKKAWKIIVGIVAVIVVLNAVSGALFGDAEEMLPMVDTAEVTRGDITSTLDTSGTIASELIRVYASPVSAQVGEVPVAVGQSVLKGDFLLTYDTTSLQKSYDIAELQAKAENATTSDTLAKSNESATDLATSTNDINTLQAQADTLNAEISSLQSQATGNELDSNKNAATNEEIAKMQAEIEGITAQISALETQKASTGLSDKEKEKLKELKNTKKSKEKKLEKKEKSLKKAVDIANNLTNIQAQLSQKNTQLADVQSKLAEAQSKKAAAEAGILSESAKANISYSQQASKLTLEQSAEDLSKAKAGITADFDGIVTEVQTAAGTMAAEGAALISLANADEMCVEIPVSKYNLANLKLDQKATVTFQDKEYPGTVSYISKIATTGESGAAMVQVKVHIDAPDDNLILGLDAKVSVELGTAENTLMVPISAVNSDTEGDFVYLVENNLVVKKYITTGMTSDEYMEIKTGIEEGEKVITTVDSAIVEGMPVMENIPEETESTEAAEIKEESDEPELEVKAETAE
ncbi:MAG: efflux RND transporter periplasmic adaptor subunit [Lachnospiraceae bacterium]|nr:efflux RND transporter periplasmic adaptor subunit [Lachnospiraceae bacterium]